MEEINSYENEDVSCPICLEDYKFPKLLRCRHTFCSTCLDAYASSSRNTGATINCPFCRCECKIPKNGVEGLLTNFFVDDKVMKHSRNYCETCGQPLTAENDPCFNCSIANRRNNDENAASSNHENDHENHESADLDSRVYEPFSVLFSSSKTRLRTNLQVSVQSSVSLGTADVNDTRQVNAMCLTPDNECLTVVNCSPCIKKINEYGEFTSEMDIGINDSLLDIACRSDGSLFLLFSGVVLIEELGGVLRFAVTKPCIGISMAVFPDDRLVVVGFETKEPEESSDAEDTQEERQETGKMLIFSKEGSLMYTLEPGAEYPNFRPFDVAINPVSNLIYVSDPAHQCVYIFLEYGTFIDKFVCDVPGFLGERFTFVPFGICCDSSGNVIVIDRSSKKLFRLTADGKYHGTIASASSEGFGDPFLVRHGKNGTLWIGDKFTGILRTFTLVQYVNVLDAKC